MSDSARPRMGIVTAWPHAATVSASNPFPSLPTAMTVSYTHLRPGPVPGRRVAQADRLKRAKADGIRPALRHHLYGHTALVDLRVRHIKVVDRRALGVD